MNFPVDSYELTFIFGFDKDFSIQRKDVSVKVSDRILYTDWKLNHVMMEMQREQVEEHVNYVALSDEERLMSFYVVNAIVTRADWNVLKLSLLWIPPSILFLVFVIIFIVLSSFGVLTWVATGVLSGAVIGITGWVLNYLSKSKEKAVPQKPERRTILDETCEVDGEARIFYELDLDEKDEVKAEISSDEAVNIYFLTRRNFTRFEKNEEFYYEYGRENVLRMKIDFTPSRSGRCIL